MPQEPGLGIRLFAHYSFTYLLKMSELFRSLRANERLWANCSGPSWQKSNLKRFAQVAPGLGIRSFAHHSFAQRSFAHLLRSLRSNERLWVIRSGRSPKMSDHFLSKSLICSLFTHFFAKKKAISSENQWANSQPWIMIKKSEWGNHFF